MQRTCSGLAPQAGDPYLGERSVGKPARRPRLRVHPRAGAFALQLRATIAKTDTPKRLVYGWASVVAKDGSPVEDLQGDTIPPDVLEDAVVDFMVKSRRSGTMHQGIPGGTVIESFVADPTKYEAMGIPADTAKGLDTGWWVGVQVTPEVFPRVVSGELSMFSIQGTARRRAV